RYSCLAQTWAKRNRQRLPPRRLGLATIGACRSEPPYQSTNPTPLASSPAAEEPPSRFPRRPFGALAAAEPCLANQSEQTGPRIQNRPWHSHHRGNSRSRQFGPARSTEPPFGPIANNWGRSTHTNTYPDREETAIPPQIRFASHWNEARQRRSHNRTRARHSL